MTLTPEHLAQRLAQRLERETAAGPARRPIEDDLRTGRRRLRRRRLANATVGCVAAVVVGTLAVQLVGQHRPGSAAGTATSGGLTDAQLVAACAATKHGALADGHVMTRSSSRKGTVATVLSADGSHWGDCKLPTGHDHGLRVMTVYPTSIHAKPEGTVDGVRSYVPWNLNTEPGSTASDLGPTEGFPTCEVHEREDTAAYDRAKAACPYFEVTWNDRRPAEVSRIRAVMPDGAVRWADVHDGYVSLDYTAPMTPALRERYAAGKPLFVREVSFYGPEGQLLVTDRDTTRLVEAPGTSIENWPSLAYGDGE